MEKNLVFVVCSSALMYPGRNLMMEHIIHCCTTIINPGKQTYASRCFAARSLATLAALCAAICIGRRFAASAAACTAICIERCFGAVAAACAAFEVSHRNASRIWQNQIGESNLFLMSSGSKRLGVQHGVKERIR